VTIDLHAWTAEPPPGDEADYTPVRPDHWHSWNGMSAELEFCEFGAALVRLLQPRLVLETGVGQGYMTRRLAEALPSDAKLVAYESHDEWRAELAKLDFWNEDVELADSPTPSAAR
jgi:O-methyltransferase